jgi:hypothetical protein
MEMVEPPVPGQLVAAIAGDAAIAPSAMTTANATALRVEEGLPRVFAFSWVTTNAWRDSLQRTRYTRFIRHPLKEQRTSGMPESASLLFLLYIQYSLRIIV